MSNVIYLDFRRKTNQYFIDLGRSAFEENVKLFDSGLPLNSEDYQLWEKGWFMALADDLATIDVNINCEPTYSK